MRSISFLIVAVACHSPRPPHTLTCTHLPHTHRHLNLPHTLTVLPLATHLWRHLSPAFPFPFSVSVFLLLLNHFVSFGPLSLFYFEFPSQNFVLVFYVNLYEICCCYFRLPHDACCIREHVASCWKTLRVLRRQMRRNVGRGVGQKHTKPGTNTHTATQKGHTHRHMGHTLG